MDELAEQISCIKAMIDRKNPRRIIVSDCTDADAGDDSVFEGNNLDSLILFDPEEVGSPEPDPVPDVIEVDNDHRQLPGIANRTPAHDARTRNLILESWKT